MDERGGQRDLLLHAMGIVDNKFLNIFFQTHKCQQLGSTLRGDGARKTIHSAHETEIFRASEAIKEGEIFRHYTDLSLYFHGMLGEIETEYLDAAGRGRQQAGEHLYRGRFA